MHVSPDRRPVVICTWERGLKRLTIEFLPCRHFKSWKLTGIFPFCAILFTAGFIVRVIGAYHYDNLIIYIVSICLVYAAP